VHRPPAPAGHRTDTTATAPAPPVAPEVSPSGKAGSPVVAATGKAGSPVAAGPVIGRAPIPPARPPAAPDGDGLLARVAGLRRRRYRWPLVGAVLATLIAVTAATAWSLVGSGGAGPAPPVSSASRPAPAPAVTLAWQAATGQAATGPPRFTADRVFVGGADGRIRALRRSDGRADWSFPAGPGAVRLGRVIDDQVYGASDGGVLWAVDARTGRQRWRVDTGGTFAAPPAVYPDNVYIGGLDNVLSAYSRDGRRQWRAWPGGEIRVSPIVVSDVVVVATRDRVLHGVDRSTEVWERTVGQVVGNPTGSGDVTCVAVDDGSVRCLRATDGKLLGRIAIPGVRLSTPVAGPGVVYASASDGAVGAWDSGTGKQRWLLRPEHAPAAPGRLSTPGRFVYVAYPDGRLAGFDSDTGAVQWEFTVADRLPTAPRGDGEFLFVAGETGTVHALRLPPGEAETPATTAPSRPAATTAATRADPATGTTRRTPRRTPPQTSQGSPDRPDPPVSSTPTTGTTTRPSIPPRDDDEPVVEPSQ
jgi:outer membrane protein assembly factor BamB